VFSKTVDLVLHFFDKNEDENHSKREQFRLNLGTSISHISQRIFSSELEILDWIKSYNEWETVAEKADCREIVAEQIAKLRDEKNIRKSIISLMQFTAMFLYFTFDKNKKNNQKNFYFFCIDGIETYIKLGNDCAFFGCADVRNIIGAIYASVQQMRKSESFLKQLSNNEDDFESWFKIIITLRDTTVQYLPIEMLNAQSTLIEDQSIDVTNWYHINDVMDKKIKAFTDLFKSRTREKDILAMLITDNRSNNKLLGTPLIDELELMHNFNKRDIIESLSYAVREIKATKSKKMDSARFVQLWKELEESKYLLRTAVIAIIFDKFKGLPISKNTDKSYYQELYFNHLPSDHTAKTYSRKILLFLLSKNEYVGFKDLIKAVFIDERELVAWKNPDEESSKAVINNFARTIFVMSNKDILRHHWSPLVELNIGYQNEAYNISESTMINLLADKLTTSFNSNSIEDNKLKITATGRFVADFNPSYEFFACNINHHSTVHYLPLVLLNDLDEIKKIMKHVFISSVQLIRETIEQEYKVFDNFSDLYANKAYTYPSFDSEKTNLLSYPYRIIENNINYLNSYIKFLRQDEKRKVKLFTDCARTSIEAVVEEYRKEYLGFIKALNSGDGGEIRREGHVILNLGADVANDNKPHLKDRHYHPYGYGSHTAT